MAGYDCMHMTLRRKIYTMNVLVSSAAVSRSPEEAAELTSEYRSRKRGR
jgi:hypothetical protein